VGFQAGSSAIRFCNKTGLWKVS